MSDARSAYSGIPTYIEGELIWTTLWDTDPREAAAIIAAEPKTRPPTNAELRDTARRADVVDMAVFVERLYREGETGEARRVQRAREAVGALAHDFEPE